MLSSHTAVLYWVISVFRFAATVEALTSASHAGLWNHGLTLKGSAMCVPFDVDATVGVSVLVGGTALPVGVLVIAKVGVWLGVLVLVGGTVVLVGVLVLVAVGPPGVLVLLGVMLGAIVLVLVAVAAVVFVAVGAVVPEPPGTEPTFNTPLI